MHKKNLSRISMLLMTIMLLSAAATFAETPQVIYPASGSSAPTVELTVPKMTVRFSKTVGQSKAGQDGALTFSAEGFTEGVIDTRSASYDISRTYNMKGAPDTFDEDSRFRAADGNVYRPMLVSAIPSGTYVDPPDDLELVSRYEYVLVLIPEESKPKKTEEPAKEEPRAVAEEPAVKEPEVQPAPAAEEPKQETAQETKEEPKAKAKTKIVKTPSVTAPARVTGLKAKLKRGKLTLSWKKAKGCDGYVITRTTKIGKKYRQPVRWTVKGQKKLKKVIKVPKKAGVYRYTIYAKKSIKGGTINGRTAKKAVVVRVSRKGKVSF